jgi:hypothetical protein
MWPVSTLTAKSNNADAIVKSNGRSAVRLHITSGLVTSDRMSEAVKEGFQKSTGGKTAPIQAKIDRFVKLFSLEPISSRPTNLIWYMSRVWVSRYLRMASCWIQ